MALTKAQEGLILEFLTETGKTLDDIPQKLIKDLNIVVPYLEKRGEEIDSAVSVITDRSITPMTVVKDGVMKQPTLYSGDRRLIREFIDWYGEKHNVTIPIRSSKLTELKEEVSILRKQVKSNVPYDVLLLEKENEIEELRNNLQNVISENIMLKKKIKAIESKNKDSGSTNGNRNKTPSNIIMFPGPLYDDNE